MVLTMYPGCQHCRPTEDIVSGICTRARIISGLIAVGISHLGIQVTPVPTEMFRGVPLVLYSGNNLLGDMDDRDAASPWSPSISRTCALWKVYL